MPTKQLAVVLKGYPRLSETFIAQELLNLEKEGFELTLFSLRHPTDKQTHPIHKEIKAKVVYLPEYLYQQPVRVLSGLWFGIRQGAFGHVLRIFLNDLRRDFSPNRVRRFGQALVMARELPENIPAIYAHFLHTPSSVARYTAILRDQPWACSAHAKDIYTSPDWEIREKLQDCQWLTTCTRTNTEHLAERANNPAKVMLNYHGLDLQRFEAVTPLHTGKNGSKESEPVHLLSVGRAVEKKGYGGLLQALASLPTELHWHLDHIGGGPLLDSLKSTAVDLGIGENISWHGALPQLDVLNYYRRNDAFVLNSCIDQHGDRDGLPNVMVEAQSQGLPVIGTTISGIPELVEHEINGLLVEQNNPAELAKALTTLITQPETRQKLGDAGRQRVHQEFEMKKSFSRLLERLNALVSGH